MAPAGAGPFPTVLFASGCSGFVPFGKANLYDDKAEELRKDGYFVVFVDYIGRAGVKDCRSGGLTADKSADELLAAAAWARSQKQVDANRISALGWSNGGGVTLAALARTPANAPAFSKAVLLYPDCRPARAVQARVPVLMLLAGADDVTPPANCAKVASSMQPGMVKSVTYPGAHHGFDGRGLPAKGTYGLGTMGYSQEAERAAWAEVRAFLK